MVIFKNSNSNNNEKKNIDIELIQTWIFMELIFSPWVQLPNWHAVLDLVLRHRQLHLEVQPGVSFTSRCGWRLWMVWFYGIWLGFSIYLSIYLSICRYIYIYIIYHTFWCRCIQGEKMWKVPKLWTILGIALWFTQTSVEKQECVIFVSVFLLPSFLGRRVQKHMLWYGIMIQ